MSSLVVENKHQTTVAKIIRTEESEGNVIDAGIHLFSIMTCFTSTEMNDSIFQEIV